MFKVSAIIPGAGRGSRFGEKKQFKNLNGEPLWAHTLKPFILSSLVDEIMHSGNHQVPWNPVALPSGVYLVDLKTGKKSFKQKITYIK